MSGAFRNEFEENPNALGDSSFTDLSDFYSYHISAGKSILALLVFAVTYRLIWLSLLKFNSMFNQRGVVRKIRAVRRKVKGSISKYFSFLWKASNDDDNELDMKEPAFQNFELNSQASMSTNIYTYATPN
jgi:hypothetical protein